MKKAKLCLLAFALVVGVGGALAFKVSSPHTALDYLYLISGSPSLVVEQFNGFGTQALDQVDTHYAPVPPSWGCTSSSVVCIYYQDENGLFRQAASGIFHSP